MATIGVRELKRRLSQVIAEVERTGEPVTITRRGRPIAELRRSEAAQIKPAVKLTEQEIEEWLAGWDELSESMRGKWPKGVTALDAVLEQRREL